MIELKPDKVIDMSYTERAAKYICYFSYGTVIFLFLKYGLPAALPFIIAFTAATVAEKAANKLSRKTGINKRIYCALILLILILALVTAGTAIFGRLIYEAREFAEEYISDGRKLEDMINGVNELSEKITAKLNLSQSMRSSVKNTVDNAVARVTDLLINKIGSILEKLASAVIGGLPSWILFVTVTLISTFYLGCTRYGNDPILKHLSSENKKRLLRIKNGVAKTIGRYVKAYATIMSITTTVLFAGFTIIGIKYAFLVALIVAVLDMLPVIGLSTVMIPWGIIELARGNAGRGFALLAIFAVAVVIREALEPKIIGKCIGANPLITLFAMYAGLKLFGIGGVIVLPMLISGGLAYLSEKEHSAAVRKRPTTKRNNIYTE